MSDHPVPFVSVVFPNFNGGAFVCQVIEALLGQHYPVDRFELIMVDNGSTDGSVEQVTHAFAEAIARGRLHICRLPENLGCSAAFNRGIARMSPEASYLLRVDDDLVVEPDCLHHLVRCAQANPAVGVVGGKVRYFGQRDRLHLIGSRISPWFGACKGIGKFALDRGQYDRPRDVQAVNGCLMLVRRSVIEAIGPIDERYFLYFEDIDWSLRVSRAGFRHHYVPDARAYHDTATPSQRFRSPRWGYFNIRNTCYLANRNFSRAGQLICWGVLSLRSLCYVPLVVWHSRGSSPEVLKAMWLGYRRGTQLLFSHQGADGVAQMHTDLERLALSAHPAGVSSQR